MHTLQCTETHTLTQKAHRDAHSDAKITHTHIYSHKPRNGVTTSVDTVTHCLVSHSPESIADILPLPVCMCACLDMCVRVSLGTVAKPLAVLCQSWTWCVFVCLLCQGLTQADIEALHTHTLSLRTQVQGFWCFQHDCYRVVFITLIYSCARTRGLWEI